MSTPQGETPEQRKARKKIEDGTRRQYRIQNRLCTQCSIPLTEKFRDCAACRQLIKERCDRREQRGLCRCGNPRDCKGKCCSTCIASSRIFSDARRVNKQCVTCGILIEEMKKCRSCLDQDRQKVIARRKEVIAHYGNECECCGENNFCFLQIDHIKGDGAKHRREVNASNLCRWLQKNNYPKDFQILCTTCNFSKKDGVECAHVALRRAELEKQLPFVDLFYGG